MLRSLEPAPGTIELKVESPNAGSFRLVCLFVSLFVFIVTSAMIHAQVLAPEAAHWDLTDLANAALGGAFLAFGAAQVMRECAIHSESVVVVKSVGVQLQSVSYSGSVQRELFDIEAIQAVIINEAVTNSEVYFYLAFLMKNESTMRLAYPTLRPRLDVLKEVYNKVHGLVEASRKA